MIDIYWDVDLKEKYIDDRNRGLLSILIFSWEQLEGGKYRK